ncbi:MAG: ABC transporter permease [Lentimicrobiaceae bacterium]|jgi:ABC-2 type transport system permease protein
MKSLKATLVTELLKLRRSKILWITILLFAFIPLMMCLMFFVQKHPEIAAKLGLIGTKASMLRLGKADWSAYLGFLTQAMAGIGLMGFGFVTSWVFGREYSDRTIKDILALPVKRSYIVISKLIVIAIWCILLILVFFISGIALGRLINISGWSGEIIVEYTKTYWITSLLTLLLCTPVAFFASYSRGYLLPMGFVILTLLMANFTGLVGLGPYFPWAIPGLYSAPAGTEGLQLSIASYTILFATSILGFAGTLAWWRFADQK